jgi:hypothetical protein
MNIYAVDFIRKILNGDHLPSGLVVDPVDLTSFNLMGLFLSFINCSDNIVLPDNLTFNGNLDLYGCTGLTSLPAGLVVTEDLDLRKCTSLTQLPFDLKVGGHLNLFYCTSLVGIPTSIEVGNQIWCEESLIDKIPFDELPLYISFPLEERIHEYYTRRLQKETSK